MEIKFEETKLKMTKRFENALIEVLKAECEMMTKLDWEYADLWTWGRCYVSDLSSCKFLQFQYGEKKDQPDDGLGLFAVVVSG